MASRAGARQDGKMLIGTVCTLLSAAGMGVAFVIARRRRYAAALRMAAVSLLPVGLAMTGVVRFVVNMTFNPVAWAGFGVLGVSVLLLLIARFADGRGGRARGAEAEPSATRPALPSAKRRGRGGAAGQAGGSGGADDFSDIEAILKKHGI
jgi:hypothetical protein